MDAVAVHEAEIAGTDRATERFDRFGLFEEQSLVEHVGDMELLDDLLILYRDILLILVEVQQFLPRRRQFLVGGEDGHQRTPRQLARDDKISADRKEKEGRKVSDKIAKKLDEEFSIINLEPNVIDLAEAMGHIG